MATALVLALVAALVSSCGSKDNGPFFGPNDAGAARDGSRAAAPDASVAQGGSSGEPARGAGGASGRSTGGAPSSGGRADTGGPETGGAPASGGRHADAAMDDGAPQGTGGVSSDGGAPNDAGPVACDSDRDCQPFRQLCETTVGRCVDCLRTSDCAASKACSGGLCVAATECRNSLDCAGEDDDRTVCDPLAKICVQCARDADCGENHVCFLRQCVGFTPCDNSLACPSNQVCDTNVNRCVDCVRDADCDSGGKCVGVTCRPPCQSDNACTPLGLLCNIEEAYCAECLDHGDCLNTEFCEVGLCRPDLCASGETHCGSNTLFQCNPAGDAFTGTVCPARRTCVETAGGASCEPWVCTAGATECDGDDRVVCSANGLNEVSRTDCTQAGQQCVQGQCTSLVCTPSTLYCDPNDDIRLCSADGLTAGSVVTNCAENQYCDRAAATPTCRPRVCMPNAKVCNATCNGRGSGYVAGQSPCPSNQTCVQGNCTATPPCGNTVCPDPARGCAVVSGACLLLADTGQRTAAEAASICAGLGSGWAICSSTQICNATAGGYFATSGCECPPASTSGPCNASGFSYPAFHTAGGSVTIGAFNTTCTAWGACVGVGALTNASVACCHP